MSNIKKTSILFGILIAAGVLCSLLLAAIFGGTASLPVKMSNELFMIALLTCMVGAAKTLLPFFRRKRKLRREMMRKEGEGETTETPKFKWEYPTLAAGIVLVLVSYLLIA